MELRDRHFRLIGNRLSAVLAAGMTGFLAWRDIRAVFSNLPQKPGWLLPFDFLPLPVWSVAAINVLFYISLVWMSVWFYLRVEGNERPVVAGFYMSGLIGLLGRIDALASAHLVVVIRSFQSASMTIAFIAAVVILLKSPEFDKGDAKMAVQLSAHVGTFIAVALLLGGLIYFLL